MQPITIEKGEYGYIVRQGDRVADMMNFDEMLGQIISMIYPHDLHSQRIHEGWLKKDNGNIDKFYI